MTRRRFANSSRIASTSASASLTAPQAAHCAIEQALEVRCVWSVFIFAMISLGPSA